MPIVHRRSWFLHDEWLEVSGQREPLWMLLGFAFLNLNLHMQFDEIVSRNMEEIRHESCIFEHPYK